MLDYNGTLACDGELLEGVGQRLQALSQQLQIHVVTADTFGKVRDQMAELACQVVVLPVENQAAGKLNYIIKLGAENSVCMGNGRNDRLMLEAAALGVVLVQEEGAAVATIMAADVVCPDIRQSQARPRTHRPVRLRRGSRCAEAGGGQTHRRVALICGARGWFPEIVIRYLRAHGA